ncbi:hypothetical protein BC831DRAFT_445003 [Entophlyctis helioformis]|nr:hypothetical protein BC831DRAFT_445003 [Entophlyctis helioformis]
MSGSSNARWGKDAMYYCDFCKIYVQNNKASKQAHETANRHKNSVARHLRDVHRKQDRKARDDAKTQRLLEQVERSALQQYGQDVATGVFHQDSRIQLATGTVDSLAAPSSKPWQRRDGRSAFGPGKRGRDDHGDDEGQHADQDEDVEESDEDEDDDVKRERRMKLALEEAMRKGPYGEWTTVESVEPTVHTAATADPGGQVPLLAQAKPLASASGSSLSAAEAYAESRRLKHEAEANAKAARRAALVNATSAASGASSASGSASFMAHQADDDDDGDDIRNFKIAEKQVAVEPEPIDVCGSASAPATASGKSLFKKRKVAGAAVRRPLRENDE